jgi:hypothetical protein
MLRSPLCVRVSTAFVDHVQTDHRRNPILWIGAHLYICNQARSSEFRQRSRNCHFVGDVGHWTYKKIDKKINKKYLFLLSVVWDA